MPVLIVGCGHIGTRVAQRELKSGQNVSAWTRTLASAKRLQAQGVDTRAVDLDDPSTFPGPLAEDSTIYYFVPPPSHGETDTRMENFTDWLSRTARTPLRIVLISTTGVYGDCGGEWINEDRPANPQADRARRRLAAENTLRSYADRQEVSVVILRVAGIYGPELLPVERLRRGQPVLREQESPWSNRIHADDLADACVAAMRHRRPPPLVNATDGHPSTMTDYFFRVADALGLPRPPAISRREAQTRLSSGMQSYLAESKRIDNRRLREELGVMLTYPDLARGLAALKPGGVFNPPSTE